MAKAVIFGILFGWILQRSRVNTFNKIGGFAMLKDFTVLNLLLTAIGVGSVLLFTEIQLGLASLHVKPFNLTGVLLGGIVFGMGMAILGYCPGTLILSIGEGAVDALVGTLGGLAAGLIYIFLYPEMKSLLGPDLGKINLYAGGAVTSSIIVLLFGVILVVASVYIDKRVKR